MENKALNRKFAAIIANMLDAEKRQSWEEYDAFKKMADTWREKFADCISDTANRNQNYDCFGLQAVPELQTSHRTPAWFYILAGLVRDIFGVGVLTNCGTNATIVTKNTELMESIDEFCVTVQQQMLLYWKTAEVKRRKPQYFKGFVVGVRKKLITNSQQIILTKQEAEKALAFYSEEYEVKIGSTKLKSKCGKDYYEGRHDGMNRGTRIEDKFGQKLLTS